MSLIDEIKEIEDKLAERKRELDQREASIEGKLEAISLREIDLTGKENAIGDKNAQLDQRAHEVQVRENRIGSITDLEDRRLNVVRKELELRTWENDLALIKARQAEREEKLASERKELEEDKKNYKEELKSQFIEQLQKVI